MEMLHNIGFGDDFTDMTSKADTVETRRTASN